MDSSLLLRAATGSTSWGRRRLLLCAAGAAIILALPPLAQAQSCALTVAGPAGGLAPGSRLQVLWIGNSLTGTAPDIPGSSAGPMPARLAPMLTERGIQLKFDVRIQGGANFSDHARNPQTLAVAADPRFDAVNLQGYYEGYESPTAFLAAVRPLVESIKRGGATPLFQQVWSFQGDPGGPQFPSAAVAVEEAARQVPGALPVQVMRAWHAVRTQDPALGAKLFADGTHQSAVGEHLNALVYTRFFSGRSVHGIQAIHAKAASRLDARERRLLEDAVDAQVTVFFKPLRTRC